MFFFFQRSRINTKPQSCGSWPIRKNMTQVGVTYIAQYFYPLHTIAVVWYILHHIVLYRLGKRRPAGAGIEFYSRIKKFRRTAHACIYTWGIGFAVLPAKSSFGGMLPGYTKLFRSKQPFPFFVSFFHPMGRSRIVAHYF